MFLITGANGQTGRAIIKALLSKGEHVRAFVHKAEQIKEIKDVGVKEVVAGDMLDQKAIDTAFTGVNAVYHICSALNPNEVEIGQMAIKGNKSRWFLKSQTFYLSFSTSFDTAGDAASSEKTYD